MKARWLLVAFLGGCSLAVDGDSQGFDEVSPAPDAPRASALILNEVAPQGSPDDWFEVYNGTREPIDLARYRYSDSAEREPVPFAQPILLAPGSYFVERLSDEHPGFGLGAEEAILLFLDGQEVDRLAWLEADGIGEGSLARLPDVVGVPSPTQSPTPGYPNRGETP